MSFWSEHDRIEQLRHDVEVAESKLLESLGWKYTSSNPACIWLFEKTLADGRVAIVDRETAISFEGATYHDDDDHEDDDEGNEDDENLDLDRSET